VNDRCNFFFRLFLERYQQVEAIGARPDLIASEGAGVNDRRLVVQLLVDQVECANVIVLNKLDLLSGEPNSNIFEYLPSLFLQHISYLRLHLVQLSRVCNKMSGKSKVALLC